MRFSKSILKRTLEKKECKLSDYSDIVSSWKSLQDVVGELRRKGFLRQKFKRGFRKTFSITLTKKGLIAATVLNGLDEALSLQVTPDTAFVVTLTRGYYNVLPQRCAIDQEVTATLERINRRRAGNKSHSLDDFNQE